MIFALIIGAILYAVNRRALRWIETTFQLSRRTVRVLSVVLGASLALVLLGRLLSVLGPGLPVTGALRIGFIAQLAVLVSVLLLLPLDLALWVRRWWPRLWRARPLQHSQPAPASAPDRAQSAPRTSEGLARRAFLAQA
ncbi:MAG TPA: hypothetical protein VFK05_22185, partial [Polyangiaceae bacterium]|nr:hypothetical protein [Polyangiaceae bacterium]